MEILLNNRKCFSKTFIIPQYDNLTNKVEFIIPKTIGDIDLSEFVPKIILQDVNTLVAGITENVEYTIDDDYIKIVWWIDGVYTYEAKQIKGQVSFNSDDGKVKYSSMFTMNIVKSLESEDWDTPEKKSILDEYLARFNEIKVDADIIKRYKESAEASANKAQQFAELVGRQYNIDSDGNLIVTWKE